MINFSIYFCAGNRPQGAERARTDFEPRGERGPGQSPEQERGSLGGKGATPVNQEFLM